MYIYIYYYFCSEIGTTILKVSVVFKPTKTTWFENPSTFISKATIHDSLSLSLSLLSYGAQRREKATTVDGLDWLLNCVLERTV